MNLKTAGVLRYCRTLPHDVRVERVPYLVDIEHHTGWIDLDRWIEALGDDSDDAHLKAAFLEARIKWEDPGVKLFPVKTREMTHLASKGKFRECLELAGHLLEMDPYDPIANYYEGLCLFWYHRRFADAAASFEKAHEFGYDEFLCLYHAGLAGVFSGDFRKSGSLLVSAVKLDSRRFTMRVIKDMVRLVLIRTELYPHLLHKYSTRRHSDAQDPKREATKDEISHPGTFHVTGATTLHSGRQRY
jgi:hypothetical protein